MQIQANPHVSLTFLWHELERQIHIEGAVRKLEPELSDAYFEVRPYKSQVGAKNFSTESAPSQEKLYRSNVCQRITQVCRQEVQRPDFGEDLQSNPIG